MKITPSGLDKLFTVKSVKLEKAGERQALRITFSQPVKAGLEGVTVKRYSYLYHVGYGSPKTDEAAVGIEGTKASAGGRELVIALDAKEGAIHQVDLSALRDAAGTALEGKILYYQATKLP